MGDVVRLPAPSPGPSETGERVVGAIVSLLRDLAPEERGAACAWIVRQGLEGIAGLVGFEEAAAIARGFAGSLERASADG
jgi:hypothetical protein